MNGYRDWPFKDPDSKKEVVSKPKPKKKLSRKQRRKKRKANKQFYGKKDGFYSCKEWRELRYRCLVKYESKCMCCGRSVAEHGIVLHVDHIKPRSKFPKLELELDNLQVLCEDCNLGKSNKFAVDHRPKLTIEEELDLELLNSSPL